MSHNTETNNNTHKMGVYSKKLTGASSGSKKRAGDAVTASTSSADASASHAASARATAVSVRRSGVHALSINAGADAGCHYHSVHSAEVQLQVAREREDSIIAGRKSTARRSTADAIKKVTMEDLNRVKNLQCRTYSSTNESIDNSNGKGNSNISRPRPSGRSTMSDGGTTKRKTWSPKLQGDDELHYRAGNSVGMGTGSRQASLRRQTEQQEQDFDNMVYLYDEEMGEFNMMNIDNNQLNMMNMKSLPQNMSGGNANQLNLLNQGAAALETFARGQVSQTESMLDSKLTFVYRNY